MRLPTRFLKSKLRGLQAPHLHRWMTDHAVGNFPPSTEPALVIAPHPDDETFGCGGVIAWKRQRGIPVSIVFVTDGSRSHPDIDPAALAARRRAEGIEAAGILGVGAEDIHFMDQLDGGLRDLTPRARRAAVLRLADLFRHSQPSELYVPHHADHHPDHEASYTLCFEAMAEAGVLPEVLQYPIWLIWWGPLSLAINRGPLRGARRFDVRGVQEIKSRAIQVYGSQLSSMPRGFLKQFTGGWEIFFPALKESCPQVEMEQVPYGE